jgi:pyrroloquinoline-quinone synthase
MTELTTTFSPQAFTVSPDAGAWDSLLRPEWLQRLRDTAFLRRCREKTATVAELHLFVRQHHHYSRHFTRFLCALLSNVPDERDRTALTHNLYDEMGLTGGISHAQIYRNMMGVMLPPGQTCGVFPATQALIDTMTDCCRNPRPMVGLGALCLGAEAIVPEVYTDILSGFAGVREPPENVEFFTIHVVADDGHALTMRDIIVRELDRDPQTRLDLDYGAQRAIAARVAFFDAISAHCASH